MPIKVSIQIPSQNVLNYLTNNNFKLLKHKFYNNAHKKTTFLNFENILDGSS
jgi:hypothetical protein